MLINEVASRLISNIEPKLDQNERVLEERPASRYNNRKRLALNPYGEGPFCRFRIEAYKQILDSLGVYVIVEETERVLYIGKCTGRTSTYGKRFNTGYGTIPPRNCYKGGQSTNCRINHGILEAVENGERLTVVFHRCLNGSEATNLEAELIQQCRPPWNKSTTSSRHS